MRIAHVTDVYLPRLGGVELQVHDLAARQRAGGHETLVLTTTPGSKGDTVVRLGHDAFTVGLGPYRAVRDHAISQALHAYGVDAVHAHVSAFSPLAWAAART